MGGFVWVCLADKPDCSLEAAFFTDAMKIILSTTR
jgi:hypothetical protein